MGVHVYSTAVGQWPVLIWHAGTHICIAHASAEMAAETSSGPIDIDIK